MIVQHCILERDLEAFNRTLSQQLRVSHEDVKKKPSLTICDSIDNSRELELGLERSESSCSVRDSELVSSVEDPPVEVMESAVKATADEESTTADKESAANGDLGEPSTSGVQTPATGPGTPRTSLACLMREDPETTLMTPPHPLLVALCYTLALAHQASGLDFLSVLGLLCAAISMVSMWFL